MPLDSPKQFATSQLSTINNTAAENFTTPSCNLETFNRFHGKRNMPKAVRIEKNVSMSVKISNNCRNPVNKINRYAIII